jgi:hypothetical protein
MFLAHMYLIVVLPSCQLALFCHQTDMTEFLFVLLIMFPEGSRPNCGQEPHPFTESFLGVLCFHSEMLLHMPNKAINCSISMLCVVNGSLVNKNYLC